MKRFAIKHGRKWPMYAIAARGHSLEEIKTAWTLPEVFAMLDAMRLSSMDAFLME